VTRCRWRPWVVHSFPAIEWEEEPGSLTDFAIRYREGGYEKTREDHHHFDTCYQKCHHRPMRRLLFGRSPHNKSDRDRYMTDVASVRHIDPSGGCSCSHDVEAVAIVAVTMMMTNFPSKHHGHDASRSMAGMGRSHDCHCRWQCRFDEMIMQRTEGRDATCTS